MSSSALGVRYEGDPLPGLAPGESEELPIVHVELAPDDELERRWAAAAVAPRTVVDRRNSDGSLFMCIMHDHEAGYRIHAPGYGTHLVAADAGHLTTTPMATTWSGRRLLVGQVFPLLSVLRGYEVLHGGGVVVAGSLVGVLAPSGTGKSSTIGHLIARGGQFFADDVLALECADGEVRAHPGPRLLNLHAHQVATFEPAALDRFGSWLAADDEVHFEPDGFAASLPLTTLVFLERGRNSRTTLKRQEGIAAVLAAAYHAYVATPDRLLRQLKTAAALSERVRLVDLSIGSEDDARAVAKRLEAWVRELG